MPFVRQGFDGLGNELELLHQDGDFSGFGGKGRSLDKKPVAQIQCLEEFELIFSHVIQFDKKLHFPFPVIDIRKDHLALSAFG
ncbi:hypothetical protein DSECCO2_517180 [anaerobic digester metagenome]